MFVTTNVVTYCFREDMEKVNIQFHENGTVSYQHKKILKFVPELSVNKYEKIVVPNIPLLTLSTQSNNMGYWVQKTISVLLSMNNYKPFVSITADELVFGYDDTLVALAHQFYPRKKRPAEKMGLLINRNGTLPEVHNIYTGATGMHEFGLLANLNGKDTLPFWNEPPLQRAAGQRGLLLPSEVLHQGRRGPHLRQGLVQDTPHAVPQAGNETRSFLTYEVCKLSNETGNVSPDLATLRRRDLEGRNKNLGISADLFTPIDNVFASVDSNPNNKCYCPGNEYCPPKGLQNISPCQFDAPVYLSFPHFLDADPKLLEPFEGLRADREKHQSYFKIQPGSTPPIRRWIYLATTFADIACPLMTYGFIFLGTCVILGVFVNAYKSLMFTKETIEIGMRTLRRRSSAYIYNSNRFISRRDTYTLLDLN
ncbi:hypothetical protein NQ318_002224 [Aromia moschata]|uniref:Scavenger receptor class B member 1 n=1 Tax=Aromia moschata TaxID=1265417 RepID=A0AAV8Z4D0_9CUCU|nr:hypothetical protein NQ318_002224 [Aromia moschata]